MSATPAECSALLYGGNSFSVSIPDTMGSVGGGLNPVDDRITAYEAVFGDRELIIYSNAPIDDAYLTFDGFTRGDGRYSELHAHLGVGIDPDFDRGGRPLCGWRRQCERRRHRVWPRLGLGQYLRWPVPLHAPPVRR